MRLIIRDIRHWQVKYDTLRFGILSFIVVTAWIGFEIYHAYTTSTINPEVEKYLTPLNPSLNTKVLDNLANRFVPPEQFPIIVGDNPLFLTLPERPPLATATPTLTPNPPATASAAR